MPAQGNNQLNISIELDKKNLFKKWCKSNRTTMSEVLLSFIDLCLSGENHPFIDSLILDKDDEYIPKNVVEEKIKSIINADILPNLNERFRQLEEEKEGETNLTQYRNDLVNGLDEKFSRRLILIENRVQKLENLDSRSADVLPAPKPTVEKIMQEIPSSMPGSEALSSEEQKKLDILLNGSGAVEAKEHDITYMMLNEAYELAKKRGFTSSKDAFSHKFRTETDVHYGIAKNFERAKRGSTLNPPYHNVSGQLGDTPEYLNRGEAFEVAKKNGYVGTMNGFRAAFTRNADKPGYIFHGITRFKAEGKKQYFYKVVETPKALL